jgi:hypothetical protein
VVVNQVAASSGRQSADGDQGANAQITSTTGAGDDGNRVHATLGVTWSHAINIRFIIDSFGAVKRVRIGKSPSSHHASLLCEITTSGLSALSTADAERLGIAGHAATVPLSTSGD